MCFTRVSAVEAIRDKSHPTPLFALGLGKNECGGAAAALYQRRGEVFKLPGEILMYKQDVHENRSRLSLHNQAPPLGT